MKIIIADDQEDLRTLVEFIFIKHGIETINDPTGALLDGLRNDLPDLIILDINLQSRDGGDICTKLKNQNHTKKIPVILVSGIMDLRQISQFCGADDYLVKPFVAAELEQKVLRLLNQAA